MAEQRQEPAEYPQQSTACGPVNVVATAKGSWQENKVTAAKSARDIAKAIADAMCGGNCAAPKKCKYVELKVTPGGEEERQDPSNPNATQYRFECTSEGTCKCE